MNGPAPTDVHTRINARASIVETREFWGKDLCFLPVDSAPLVLASLIVEADSLRLFSLTHQSREYDDDRRQFYTAFARGPLHQFLNRFTTSTRQQAQELAESYTIYL